MAGTGVTGWALCSVLGAALAGAHPAWAERPCRQDQEAVTLSGRLEQRHRSVVPGERVRRAHQRGEATEVVNVLHLRSPLCMRVLSVGEGRSRPRHVLELALLDPDRLLPVAGPGSGPGSGHSGLHHRLQGRLFLADAEPAAWPVWLEVEAVSVLKEHHPPAPHRR